MSEKNRRKTYDKLVAAGRFADISEPLKKEFGDPQATPSVLKAKKKLEKK